MSTTIIWHVGKILEDSLGRLHYIMKYQAWAVHLRVAKPTHVLAKRQVGEWAQEQGREIARIL